MSRSRPERYRELCGTIDVRRGETEPCRNSASTCTLHCGAIKRAPVLVDENGKKRVDPATGKTLRDRSLPISYCSNRPRPGAKRCHLRAHRGRPAGIAGKVFDWNKNFARALPENLKALFQEAIENPALASLQAELAAVSALEIERARNLEGLEPSAKRWAELQSAADELEAAMALPKDAGGKAAALGRAVRKILKLIRDGGDAANRRREFLEITKRKQSLAQTEVSIHAQLSQLVPLSVVDSFLRALALGIRGEKGVTEEVRRRLFDVVVHLTGRFVAGLPGRGRILGDEVQQIAGQEAITVEGTSKTAAQGPVKDAVEREEKSGESSAGP